MLSRDHRFHGIHALDFAYRQGIVTRGPLFSMRVAANSRRQKYRVAVVVSKKVSKSAVVRNRIRRRMYEAVRMQATGISGPLDIIIMVYSVELATLESKAVESAVAMQLVKGGVITSVIA